MTINGSVLAEMDIADTYMGSLPKIQNMKHLSLLYTWRHKAHMSNSKSSYWRMVKEFMYDLDQTDKKHALLAERAESHCSA
ncbi:conserved hypothetical protein [Ricinus communis]|uniref:PRONE domain-containing protein n=1 Tax=Ricinus communis TaxID=3988 RepID=B9T398_RICCO|nr:conserved hypothetical protein [Ricinus communis]